MKKIYFKHIIIHTGNQDDVEKEINSYVNGEGSISIISLNVTPERVGVVDCEGHAMPKYWYHIAIVYTGKE